MTRTCTVEEFLGRYREAQRRQALWSPNEGGVADNGVEPPRDGREVWAAARKAGGWARQLDSYRRSLPRNRAKPALAKAITWLRKRGVTRLSEDVVRAAKRSRISKASLKRAMAWLKEHFPASKAPTSPSICVRGSLTEPVNPDASPWPVASTGAAGAQT
jgi:hypothetical protein